jgi:hypothetical protein
LGLAIAAIAVIWGVVLPQLEKTPRVQARIRHLDGHGIDPAAFFYTDHPGMSHWEGAILRRLRPEASRMGNPEFDVKVGSAAAR